MLAGIGTWVAIQFPSDYFRDIRYAVTASRS
jgi:hypothetical protein